MSDFSRDIEKLSKHLAKISEATLQPQQESLKRKRKHNAKHGAMQICFKQPGKCPAKTNQQFILAKAGEVKVFCLAEVPCWNANGEKGVAQDR